jgi:hypothetical protein
MRKALGLGSVMTRPRTAIHHFITKAPDVA